VKEHCLFLKEVPDAVALRKAIVDRFERANMPSVPPEEKRRILSFVVVGGGEPLSLVRVPICHCHSYIYICALVDPN
jgi:hypothetical protein